PSQTSSVQMLPSSGQDSPLGVAQFFAASLQVRSHGAPFEHGSPAWTHVPPWHTSAPLQNLPSSHGAALFGCVHVPVPLQTSSVQTLPSSLHAVPAGSTQVFVASLQVRLQSAPPAHGSPAWPQTPSWQTSVPLQKSPSSQGSW